MVQGLAFLSKKSWHTKNLSNQEKVWMAEQRKEAEANKTKELAKQIQQEREREELDRISGKKTVMDRGIDWMYQGSAAGDLAKKDAEKRAEEFLMGKEYVGEGATQGDFDDGDQKQGIHNVVAHAAAAQPEEQNDEWYNEPSVKDRNENFRLRVEDPMFLVSRQEQEKINKHQQTKALYERVVGHVESDSDGGEDKGRRKEKKRHKKKRSKRDDDIDRKSRRRRRHSRSRSNERRHKHRRRERSYSRSRSRSRGEDSPGRRHKDDRRRDDKYSRYREEKSRRRDYDNDRRDNHRRRDYGDHRHRSTEGSEERYHRRRDEDRRNRSDDRGHHEKERSHHHEYERESQHEKEYLRMKKDGYGLKGATTSTVNKNDLGPSKELLLKKRDEREAERRRIRETASKRRTKNDEDRARALQEMQADSRQRDETMKLHAAYRRKPDEDDDEAPTKGKASFLDDITKQTHGISGDGSASLSARVAQNRHTNQRLHDSFL